MLCAVCKNTLFDAILKKQPIDDTPSITNLPTHTTTALTPVTFCTSEEQHSTRTHGTQDNRKLQKHYINNNYSSNTKHYSKFKPYITSVSLQIHNTTDNNQ